MKNIWKWIIGIVLVVVVVAGLAGAIFVVHNRMAARFAIQQERIAQGTPGPEKGPITGQGFPGWHQPGREPMGGFGPFHHGYGYGDSQFHRGRLPFGPGFMILGGLMRLVPLALLALLVVGAYLLGRRANVVSVATAASVPTHACPKCGEPVQDGSKYCPNCGKKQ